ncbi:MAG: biotin--[acetyl-CoA-carboxylase] ligase [Actinomycetota bacterium]|nr:biotin--[acetyl-CoA-carboxylase] ligase [Actinomycetota bacterium]
MSDAVTPHPSRERRPLDDARMPGWRLEFLASAGSTNAVAARRAEPGLVMVTDHQTAGRGRLDRGWETPAGLALTFSAVVDPGVPDARWPWLPLLAGLAVADAVRRTTGVEATLKWPNDVLVEDRKLAGILVERVAPYGTPVAVIGIGLNVHQAELPVENATSLALEGSPADRADVLEAVLGRLAAELADWRAAGGDPVRLRAAYEGLCSTIGRAVTVQLPGEQTVSGRADTVDELGRLVVLDAEGERVPVGAGDVVHVRPAD